MAVVFMEGFDHCDTTYKGWSGSANSYPAGRYGGLAAAISSVTFNKTLPGNYTTYFCGQALQIPNVTLGTTVPITLRNASTRVVDIFLTTSGGNNVFCVRGPGGAVLATGTTPILANVWNYVELKVVVSATVGIVEMRLNGSPTPECIATNVNTGTLAINNVLCSSAGGGWGVTFDDMYGCDTSGSAPTTGFLGDVRVEKLSPNANGANTAWTGVYTDWNDATAPNGDTAYVSSATPGDKETSALADLALVAGTVYAVQTNLIARKDDAGARQIAPVLRVGGVDYDGTTSLGLSASYIDYMQIYDRLDPSGAAWTLATVNAMEAGVKEVA